MAAGLWQRCIENLETQLSEKDINTWIRPLQAIEQGSALQLLAPNQLVVDRISLEYLPMIKDTVEQLTPDDEMRVELDVGEESKPEFTQATTGTAAKPQKRKFKSNLDKRYTFETFVQGKSNQIARAAAEQVAESPHDSYNPLLIYGGVGLGKTHLMHCVANRMLENNPEARVLYLHSEKFVHDMVTAMRHNKMDEFKGYYRKVDALLIDDIQFFAGKKGSQEEFFHTFNALLEGRQQIIMTCDRYPAEVEGLDKRLSTRCSWGLSVSIDPPELETRVAILISKAELVGVKLSDEVAFFISKRVRSNVRDLESALHRLLAGSKFTGQEITIEFAKQVLQDMLSVHDRLITLDGIKRTICEYFNIRASDLIGKSRSRSVARPRQVAMSLAKELTNHSLPEIGEAFGGRDHTTVLHACRKVKELRDSDMRINEDYTNLMRTLSN